MNCVCHEMINESYWWNMKMNLDTHVHCVSTKVNVKDLNVLVRNVFSIH